MITVRQRVERPIVSERAVVIDGDHRHVAAGAAPMVAISNTVSTVPGEGAVTLRMWKSRSKSGRAPTSAVRAVLNSGT